jgi:hypothetical protein
VTARVLIGPDTWQTALLFVPEDFDSVRIGAMHSESGTRARPARLRQADTIDPPGGTRT